MIGNIIFDGVNSLDYGVHVTDLDSDNAPDRIYQIETVPGRNGHLAYDTKSFNNITIRYPAFVYDDYAANIRHYRNYLASKIGYKRLESSFYPEEFRLARYASPMSASKTVDDYMGHFMLEFDCKPQRFLKSGEVSVQFDTSGVIYNPTLFDAKPLLRVYGNGSITINGTAITINSPTNYVDIDCDLMDAYFGLQNMNQYINLSSYDFPVLASGENAIILGSGITRVILTPRWWQI